MKTRLTADELRLAKTFADPYIEAGLSCASMDVAEFARHAALCYRFAGLRWHANVVRVSSPLVGAFAAPIARHVVDSMRRSAAVSGAVRSAVGSAVDGAVRGAVRGAVDGAVGRAVGDAVGRAVDGAVGSAVGDAVDGAVGSAVGDAVRQNWTQYLGGSWWLSWQAYTGFFRAIGLDLPDDIWARDEAYCAAQKSCGWWWPHSDFVVACDRPEFIRREQVAQRGYGSHRLHAEDGPAIRWRDGWALWYWHGVQVTQQVIESPETIAVAQIDGEKNAEIRRIMIERLGPGEYLKRSGARVLDMDALTIPGSAPRVLMVDSRGGKWLVGTDGSTRRVYTMPVPREVETCRQAHQAIAGFDESFIISEA